MSGLRVAVVAGGPSTEAEVSRESARGVHAALGRAGHQAELLELDTAIARRLSEGSFEVVFPVTHGTLGEDGCLQGLLEVLDLPYVGSGVLASALAASKPHAKALFLGASLPLAEGATLTRADDLPRRVEELRSSVGPALVAKPASGGSAIGVEVLAAGASNEDVIAAVERVLLIDPVVVVERFVTGLEVTCGVLETDDTIAALPPTLIRPRAAAHYDFVSKYRAGGSEHICPAPFAAELISRIQSAAIGAHRALGCRDLSRTDFVVDDVGARFVVLEVNTLPGMTPVSLFPEAARAHGISFEALCDGLARRAASRPRRARLQALAMP